MTVKFLFIVLFYHQFRLCITKASGKAHTPCRAVPWCRRCLKQDLSWRRKQAPALRCKPIISQIGRENNISAENYVSRTVEDAGPYNLVNILMRTLLNSGTFYYSNKGVEKYLSAVSGRTVTTVFPFPSFFARRSAAATLVPLDIPHIMPSLAARSLDV